MLSLSFLFVPDNIGEDDMSDGTKILIVEDNPLLRETLREILHLCHPDWHVFEAANGQEGIELAQSTQPDLIVLDFHMPVMNGYDMAMTLQEQPGTRAIPLVLNTSEDADHPLIKRLRTICTEELYKPFSLRELEKTIQRVLTARPFPQHDFTSNLQPALT